MTVAPFTGAWIETSSPPKPRRRNGVAPFTGAWIETFASSGAQYWAEKGRPLHGGVDRNGSLSLTATPRQVAPFTGAWIETAKIGAR